VGDKGSRLNGGGEGSYKLPEFNLSYYNNEGLISIGGSFGNRISFKEYYQRYLSREAWRERRMSSNNKFDYYITFKRLLI